jgi:hypothetical protein
MMWMLSRELSPYRLVVYVLLIALIFEGIVLAVRFFGWESVILEGGLVEQTQMGILLVSILMLAGLALKDKPSRELFLFMALLAGLACVRELNNTPVYQRILPARGAKLLVAIAILGLVMWRCRTSLWPAIRRMSGRPGFILYVFGAAMVVLWAQVLTQDDLLNPRPDRTVEESLELAGYALILFGTLEEYFALTWGDRQPTGGDFS